ncbi:hypothetical protein KIL84_011422 [Mauremys mutica]|uniref:Uncharacterized protein n=1 Tax=Mauremys mutica TaxID=74926 RepID=A0A9D4B2D8_9SAUR|nr:hypothetical protein KIL84_011422 [Mauremys mutica]
MAPTTSVRDTAPKPSAVAMPPPPVTTTLMTPTDRTKMAPFALNKSGHKSLAPSTVPSKTMTAPKPTAPHQFLQQKDIMVSSVLFCTDGSLEHTTPDQSASPTAPLFSSNKDDKQKESAFSSHHSSPTECRLPWGPRKSKAPYGQDMQLWYGQPWMGPPIAFPMQWPSWTYGQHKGLITIDLQPHPEMKSLPPSSILETSEAQGETGDEREEGTKQDITSPAQKSSSSLDEAIIPPPPTMDNCLKG